ncbi:MAG: NAD(P)/FAD-dependent oxidoreductase, partial [Thermoplasmatales archaeon]|nr:NAD(P)/FAD-dependent oxidoreductase [Thermoplasmatales archaeon]
MKTKTFDTVIVGAGISGLACARSLSERGEDFLIVSEDIGGRILTSEDGNENYGA